MSVIYPYNKVDLENYPLDENLIKDHESIYHVCLMKLFPLCSHKDKPPEGYQKFHLRFYIPKKNIVNLDQKIDRVIVMLNGLDEIEYYTLYDQLGQKFAEYNIGSVLLPLPAHLNRNPRFRHKPDYKRRPSDDLFDCPEIGLKAYEQIMKEFGILINHLRLNTCPDMDEACSFYKNFFSPHVKISLLGYSVSSLVALANFIDKPDIFTACFSINGGIQLSDLEFPENFIDQKKWNYFVSSVTKDWKKKTAVDHEVQAHGIFARVFLGDLVSDLKEELKKQSRRILFIIGGNDRVMPYSSIERIEPKAHGLSVLKIPGLGHFLPIEKEWSKWLNIVVSLINIFDENAGHELLTSKEITESLIKLDRKYKFFKRDPSIHESDKMITGEYDLARISNPSHKKQAEQLMLASLAYYDRSQLIEELNREYLRNYLGQRLIKDDELDNSQLEDCLNAKKVDINKPMGEIIKEKKYVREKIIQRHLKEIEEFYCI